MSAGNTLRVQNWRTWPATCVPELVPRPRPDALANVVILGTFKHWTGLVDARQEFQERGFHVMAPDGNEIVEDPDGFPILDTDIAKIERIEGGVRGQAE